jgi:hypothetical protein
MRSAFILMLMVAACGPSIGGDDHGSGDDDDDDGGASPDASVFPPPGDDEETCQKMDILFVVDDSGSMAEEQDNLAANFPAFAELLNSYLVANGTALDYHVAITTTGRDVAYTQVISLPGFPPQALPMSEQGDDGAFRNTCDMPRRWLERTDPSMATTFACAAAVGTGGPSMEMPLYASELAFSARVADGTNAGFLRDDALLAVVYLTDEDDCSRHDNNFSMNIDDPCTTEPPQQWVDFFDQLKGDRGRWATAVIAGPTDCESDFGSAAAAPRLQQFVQLTGANAVFASICDGNLEPALQSALDTFTSACDSFPPIP